MKLAGKKYSKLFAFSWFGHRRDEKKRSKVTRHAAEKLIKIACTASTNYRVVCFAHVASRTINRL